MVLSTISPYISPMSPLYLACISPGARPDGALHGDVRDRLRLAAVRPRAHLRLRQWLVPAPGVHAFRYYDLLVVG